MKKNSFVCDIKTGVCGVDDHGEGKLELIDLTQTKKKVDLYYVTDPICSHCWALELTLRWARSRYRNNSRH